MRCTASVLDILSAQERAVSGLQLGAARGCSLVTQPRKVRCAPDTSKAQAEGVAERRGGAVTYCVCSLVDPSTLSYGFAQTSHRVHAAAQIDVADGCLSTSSRSKLNLAQLCPNINLPLSFWTGSH